MKVLLVVMVLCQLLLSDAMASIQSRTADGPSKKKGGDGLGGLFSNNTKYWYNRSRRSVHVTPFQDCYTQFFAGYRPPTGFRKVNYQNKIKYICQQIERFEDTLYSTMFDESIGIAIYSAYVVPKDSGGLFGAFPRVQRWTSDPDIGRQGSNQIYEGSSQVNIHRGHLVPAETYSFDCLSMVSTFKYTNAVPQHTAFNTGPWKVYEQRVRKFALENCQLAQGDLFLLTGTSEVIIGNTAVKNPLKYFPTGNAHNQADIAIPNSMWTAGCCVVNTVVHGAFAAIGNNNQLNNQMHQLTVEDLEKNLAIGIGGNAKIELFPAGGKPEDKCSYKGVQFRYDERFNSWTKSKPIN